MCGFRCDRLVHLMTSLIGFKKQSDYFRKIPLRRVFLLLTPILTDGFTLVWMLQ